MTSISEDESLELGGCWLELGYRSINAVPSDPRPLWYPDQLKTISTERIRARYDWLSAKATRSPGNWMRLKGFDDAEETTVKRAKRRASKCRDKIAKRAGDWKRAKTVYHQPVL